jgi:hypothetical protein
LLWQVTIFPYSFERILERVFFHKEKNQEDLFEHDAVPHFVVADDEVYPEKDLVSSSGLLRLVAQELRGLG